MLSESKVKKTINQFLNSPIRSTRKPGSYLWCGLDSSENFELNKNKLNYYLENPIEYHLNEDCFRSKVNFDDLKGKTVDLYIGCSHTFGTGHNWKNTWPYLVSKHTNNHIVNLGVPGGGVDISYINLKKYIDKFKVKNVFHYQPIYSRYYLFDGFHQTHNIISSSTPYFSDFYKKHSLVKDESIVYNHYRCIDACKGICSEKKVNYLHINDFQGKNDPITVFDDYINDIPARDLRHLPVSVMKKISKLFIEKLAY
tara:strand:+ start:724 stop:1488 length:765 start_codon:yes stop_codon:yes gene_type:complete